MKGSRPLSDREVWRVARSMGKRDRALLVLGVCSGFRISELLSLRVGDVERNGRPVSAISVARKSMKGKFEGRTIPFAHKARKAVMEWLAEIRSSQPGLSPESFLFESRKGGAISRVHAWRVLAQAFAGNKMTGKLGTHSMRKTFAAKMYASMGHDLLKTQRAIGHHSINTTVAYLSFSEVEINEAVMKAWR